MEMIIARLLEDFENGKMTRRQLIKSLAVASAAAPAIGSSSPAAAQGQGFKTIALDHISYQVTDYKRTRDFYADLMGMNVTGDNGTNQCTLHFGDASVIARNRRQPAPGDATVKSVIDHVAFKIANWDTDRVKAELERRGLAPRLDTGGGDGYASFHVKDPDGWDLQISGDPKPGDPLYKKKG
jgi:catechol 2,3-dioxygenase-like lactoylglutathione lyase family enzyme